MYPAALLPHTNLHDSMTAVDLAPQHSKGQNSGAAELNRPGF
jgi:hypothetical protein